ncbi:MAG TPA: hypothetical protein VMU95_41055 [Trebonia sp.]|nr:hypothetical protein [Trebonia sp.]
MRLSPRDLARARRDDLIALTVALVVAALSLLGSRFATFRLYFAWPEGGTWSNTIATYEDLALGGFVVWYFRDSVGKRLLAWWNKHHGPHMDRRDERMRRHVSTELVSLEQRLMAHIDAATSGRGDGGN